MWAKQRQILQYMEHVVKKYGLEPHLQLRTTMKKSVWNEKENNWKIELTTRNSSFEVTADYLILAIGALHVPQFPNLDGLSKIDGSSSFHGDSFHAAQWNHNVSLVGKKVGIIGSGASAIQIVPEIAKTVGELYVFQRTAPYVFYKTDFEFPTFMKVLFRYVPFLMRIIRWGIFIATESRFSGLYENSLFNWWMKWDALRYMKSIVKDPELRKKITPDYTIGCKRMLFSSFWYPALCRNNVHIITNRLVGITENGITVQEEKESQDSQLNQQQKNIKEIDLDVIVYATGFQLTRDNAPEAYKFEVIGRNGISLNEWHQTGPSTLLGITAPKFPNLFHVYGPNSNLGHNSIIFMIECQTNYVIELIKKSQKKGYQNIEVKQEAVDKFQKSVIQKGMKGKVILFHYLFILFYLFHYLLFVRYGIIVFHGIVGQLKNKILMEV